MVRGDTPVSCLDAGSVLVAGAVAHKGCPHLTLAVTHLAEVNNVTTFPDQLRVLAEVGRVARVGGRSVETRRCASRTGTPAAQAAIGDQNLIRQLLESTDVLFHGYLFGLHHLFARAATVGDPYQGI